MLTLSSTDTYCNITPLMVPIMGKVIQVGFMKLHKTKEKEIFIPSVFVDGGTKSLDLKRILMQNCVYSASIYRLQPTFLPVESAVICY